MWGQSCGGDPAATTYIIQKGGRLANLATTTTLLFLQ